MARPALGRGLGALLGGASSATSAPATAGVPASLVAPDVTDGKERIERLALSRIRPCPFQPRKEFAEESLRELADSIREQGILQPLIVRKRDDGFELIAGERRWRAAQLAGIAEVPALVREATDAQVLELALIENLQRDNLNPMEEAQGYQALAEQFQLRQEDVAARVGKGRVVVANALRLLRLPLEVQGYVRGGQLSVGHAKVILGLARPEEQTLAAQRALRDGLSVRQTEGLVTHMQGKPPGRDTPALRHAVGAGDPHVAALESRLQERLGTKVGLRYRRGRGTVVIHFFDDHELGRVLQLLGVDPD